MTKISRWLPCALVLLATNAGRTDEIVFNRDVRPILSANCFACHGFDSKHREADLRLDVPDDAFAERQGVAAIKPGDPLASEVWKRITSTDPEKVMPPPDSKKTLTPAQREMIRRWIEQGATYQKHWAFEPIQSPPEPAVKQTSWPRTPVDRFLLAELERRGLAPNPDAAKSTLIRRVSFALTGLPPTLEEIRAFEADTSPAAYEQMVQRYLDSPHYGEEMARHWLDIARYADTHGLHLDNEREMWAYRDWVIGAFNRNLPYDQFTIEQLAGDLLPEATQDQLTATGFNRCNVTTSEGGSINEEFLYRYAVDRTSTTVQAWMGLTAGCAVCHDHKFDPLTMREFYSLYSFFYSAADPGMDGNIRDTQPFLLLATPEQTARLAELKSAETQAKQQLNVEAGRADVVVSAEEAQAPRRITDIWFDDMFPPSQKLTTTSRNKATWITAEDGIAIPSGIRALRQAGAGKYQDRWEKSGIPLVIPAQAEISFEVWIDRFEPPQAIMLELTTSRGVRRVLLGNAERLGSGTIGKPERFRAGDLPPAETWTTITVSGEQLDLKAGDIISGIAFEELGGVVCWDYLRVTGELPAADDPRASFEKWWAMSKGQDVAGVAAELQPVLKAGPVLPVKEVVSAGQTSVAGEPPQKAEDPEQARQVAALRKDWLTRIARPTSPAWQAARLAYDRAVAERTALEDRIVGTFIYRDLPQPRDAFVMLRGQYDKPGEKVEPSTPAALPPLHRADASARPTRLDLARWLVSPEHPLTARVAVNRIWQQFFGTGIVKTSDDFGSQGEPPSHPELLDWLAAWYRDHNWDTKSLVRMLVLSSAFRQDSRVTPEELQADRENRLLSRGPRIRLDAEQVRDNALFVSGLIDLTMGGAGVKPYQPPNIWEPVGYADSNTRFYLQDHGADLYRRSIYCFLKRTAPPPFMSNFDGPNREQLCARRERSNSPLQALQLMNDVQHVEAARSLAARVLREAGASPEARIALAYLLILARPPAAEEQTLVLETLQKHLERYRRDPAAAEQLIHVGEAAVPASADAPELAAYTLIASLLLNLDETVTRN